MKVKMNPKSCSDFLSFVLKLRCSLKKKGFLVESPHSYRFPPQNVFQQPRGTLLRNLH